VGGVLLLVATDKYSCRQEPHVLKTCGDNLTRENIMKQAASIKDLELGGLLPGVKVNTSATDFAPISQLQLMKFKGETWDRFGEIFSGDVGG
jgi:branched-chain amino acid transport system substrate-binding protein